MTALFHIQQCAEKALKAYLVRKTSAATKTHDLVCLVDICMERDKRFETIRLIAVTLTPLETAGRYPDTTFTKPHQDTIQRFIDQSEFIYNFVVHRIEK